MALSAGAAIAKDEAVRTELEEDFANQQLRVRIFIGKRSTIVTIYDADLERV
jgi:hypothetical protein